MSNASINDVITGIYNAVDPFRPLESGAPAHVECEAERGEANVLLDLGPEILRSNRYTCQLYTGHQGAGKSTELLRLKKDLEEAATVPNYRGTRFGFPLPPF